MNGEVIGTMKEECIWSKATTKKWGATGNILTFIADELQRLIADQLTDVLLLHYK